jgi:hypothetical protein
MFFSAKELSHLVIETLQETHPEERSIHQLIYFLHFPTEEVPITIAEVLCSDEDLLSRQDRLGKRLAWGHAEDLSRFRDIEMRASRQLRISRQLNRIVLYLATQKAPNSIGGEFSNLVERFVHILHYFDARKENAQLAYAAEEVLLLEKILESMIISKDLAQKFISLLFEKLKPSQVKTVSISLRRRLEHCEEEAELLTSGKEKSDDPGEQLIIPSESPPLKESLREHKEFSALCKDLHTILEQYTGAVPQLH